MMFFKIVSYRCVGEAKINVRVECSDVDDGKLPNYFDPIEDYTDITQVTAGMADMECEGEKVYFQMLVQMFATLQRLDSSDGNPLWTLSRIFEKVLNAHGRPK